MSWEVVSCWIESHPGLASWVQAFGSIAAILAAIWLAGRDSRARRLSENDAKISALWRAYTAVDDTVRRVGSAVKTAEAMSIDRYAMGVINDDLRQAEQHLKEAMSGPGMTPEIYRELFATRTSVEDVTYAINAFHNFDEDMPEILSSAHNAVNQVMTSRSALKKMQDAMS